MIAAQINNRGRIRVVGQGISFSFEATVEHNTQREE